jgi:O-antigen ligase
VMLVQWDTIERRLTDISPIYNRLALWGTALNMAAHNPVLGVGYGYRTFNDAKLEYLVQVGPSALARYALEPGVPHNEFLHVLATTGIVGFAAHAAVIYQAWRLARRRRRADVPAGETASALPVYVQAMLLVYIVSGMFAELFYFKYFLTLIFFMLGVLAAHAARAQTAS